MASTSTYGTTPFQPLARTAMPPQGCRVQSGPDSAGLTKAMSMVVLQDGTCSRPCDLSQDMARSQEMPCSQWQNPSQQHQPSSQAPVSFLHALPRRLALELSQTHSQELPMCTPDFATPGEQQQFLVDYDSNPPLGLDDEVSRSPAPSPRRHIKRPRPFLDAESDSQLSQPSQSQSRSQGEPSTCSKAASGLGGPGKPPMHPRHPHGGMRKRKHEPPVIRNPYLTAGNDSNHIYHAANYNISISSPQQRLFWDFKQEDRLGSGNFSEVYSVVHRMSGKRYALKKSRRPVSTLSEKNMWLAEVQALAAVEGHPNVVQFYDSWVEPADSHGSGEWFFIRMELCGSSLRTQPVLPSNSSGGASQQMVGSQGCSQGPGVKASAATTSSLGTRHGPREAMKESDLIEVLKQMASALKHVHDRGLAHLDLKPDNIYRAVRQTPQSMAGTYGSADTGTLTTATSTASSGVTTCSSQHVSSQHMSASQQHASGSSQGQQQLQVIYKLGDFGLATAKSALAPYTEGDARYLAPELLSGRSDWGLDRADMFALGATLYELATGANLPTGGDRYHALRAGQLMMMPCVSVKMQQLIKKLMSTDPKDRPSADQVLGSSFLAGRL